jgi:hypothetical protein
MSDGIDRMDELLKRLLASPWKERDGVKAEMVAAIQAAVDPEVLRSHLEGSLRGINDLELRWEVQAVLEETKPPAPPQAEPEPPKPEEKKKLNPSDLVLMYDDPRGLLLHKTKVGDRWFATQADQRTGQPQTFELRPQEIAQLRTQLAGSPYWVLGSGGGAAPAPVPPPKSPGGSA